MNKPIKRAAIAGILYPLVVVPLTIFGLLEGYLIEESDDFVLSLCIFNFLVSLILFTIFIHGFKLLAEKYQNTLLKTSSRILRPFAIVYHGHVSVTFVSLTSSALLPDDIISLQIIILILMSVILGGVSILFGIGLLKLEGQFGAPATAAGVIEIIIGTCFLVPSLVVAGILLFVPFYILASMILFRAARKIDTIFSV